MSPAPTRTIAVIIGAVDGTTRDEAFRAALGLSLRGGRVYVALTDMTATLGPESERARALLAMMGHLVEQPAAPAGHLAHADVVEIWGPVGPAPAMPPPARGTAHLVRSGRRAAFATPGEPVLHLPPVLDRDDADRLLDQLLASDRVAVW